MKKHNILFVDDEQSILNALKRVFRKESYNLFFADKAEEALNILHENHCSLIITDFRMPEMNGVDFLQKTIPFAPDSIRIVLSGYADVGAILNAINKGEIYKYITKPWDDEELKLTVQRAIEQYDTTQENMRLINELNDKNKQLLLFNTDLSASLDERTNDLILSHHILDNLPLPVLGLDNDDLIVLVNNQAQEKIMQPTKSIFGASVSSIISKETMQQIKDNLNTNNKLEVININIQDESYQVLYSSLKTGDFERGIILIFNSLGERGFANGV